MIENVLPTGIVVYGKLKDGICRVFIDYDLDTLVKSSSLLLCHELVTNKPIKEWEEKKGIIKVKKLNIIKTLVGC